MTIETEIIVIGGGAAGCMAALAAARKGTSVILLERNQKLGRKLYITGKGRCNVTNNCSPDEVLKNIPHNSRFLTSSITRFPPASVMELFTSLGVALKTERGSRVFPQSDKAADIIDALLIGLRRAGVEIREERASGIRSTRTGLQVQTERGEYRCKAIILATGGVSYPLTGSTGDGYRMAAALGHTIIPPKPSLVPLTAVGEVCRRMQGLSLRNVAVRVKNSRKKVIFHEQGEMLFTHFGLSGPLILSASAHMRDFDREHYTVWIDMKPALDEKTLDARLLRDLAANPNRAFHNVLDGLVPRLMVPVLADLIGIPDGTKANSVTREGRRRLLELLKAFPVEITGPRPIEEAIVTSGGIKVTEVDPKTMESKIVKGIYFAGEVLDTDAYTGGFNLQIAWSTGHAAGESAAEAVLQVGGDLY